MCMCGARPLSTHRSGLCVVSHAELVAAALSTGYRSVPGRYSRTTVQADLQRIPLQDNSLDGAIVLHVLEHVPDWKQALRELHRVLRPGGFLEKDTPCYEENESGGQIENCTATRAANQFDGSKPVGYLCQQPDHLWGLDCYRQLAAAFDAVKGFSCHNYPAELTVTNSIRFIGFAQTHKPGRIRCTKVA